MKKYIIRNCPAYDNSIEEWNCLGSDACECKDGHCLLKRIVEKAKNASPYNFLSKEILDMLEIEECE
jgi:hypothetical protein